MKAKKALEIFKQLALIPHGSGNLEEISKFIINYLKERNCVIKTDPIGNIYFKKGKPKICFQAHTDMVTVGESELKKPIETYEEDGFLKAKNSSLGADNGIAVAAIMALVDDFSDFEALLTVDEENGMYGAKDLEIAPESRVMINLDSESFGEIVISCAGGFELLASLPLSPNELGEGKIYKVTTKGFLGGHSGIQIGQNIENAIIELASFLSDFDLEIIDFAGGEKRNSIPVGATAIICTKDANFINAKDSRFEITISSTTSSISYDRDDVLNPLLGLHAGVLNCDATSLEVLNSRNLAIVDIAQNSLNIQIMGRANKSSFMKANEKSLISYFKAINKCAKVEVADKYMPWENSATAIENSKLLKMLKSKFENPKIANIHAGLECGIIQEKLRTLGVDGLEIFSIGPDIFSPHSVDEKMDIASFERLYSVLEDILKTY